MTERRTVRLDATASDWFEPPWPAVFELTRILPTHSWTLVGGLMVTLHARIAELPASRTTVDVDTALHLETGVVSFAEVAKTLTEVGYALDTATRYAYRFDRGADRIDVMCSDRYAAFRHPTFRGRPLFGIPGATRALKDTWNIDLTTATGTGQFVLPTIQGALVLKGAAYLEDSRSRARHLEDAILLFACIDDPESMLQGLSRVSRRRIRALITAASESSEPWVTHDLGVQALARENIAFIA